MKTDVVVAVSPHADDVTIFCGGTVAKFAREGRSVHIVRVTNDEKDSLDLSKEETIAVNAREAHEAAAILGAEKVHDFGYVNDEMDPVSEVEIRGRFVRLFRELKPHTVLSFDPWGVYEENPDHVKTAVAVDDACWQCAGHLHHEEHIREGLEPHTIAQRLYFARKLPEVNHIVDITDTIDAKIEAVSAHKTMMINMMHTIKAKLAANGLRIPFLDEIDEGTMRAVVDQFMRQSAAAIGGEIGVKYGEAFRLNRFAELEEFVEATAIPL
jgi:LmbE family N-acetylglucosaminyl deacetylase